MGMLSNIWVKLGLDSKGFTKGLGEAEKSTSKFSNSMKAIGKTIAGVFAVSAIIAWGKAAFDTITNFEAETSKLAATLGKTSDEIKDLEQLSLDLGRRTRYTATQVTQLANELGKLGFNNREISDASESILNLATATGSDLANAAKIAGSALRAFNLSTEETDRVASVLAVSTTKSALSISDFETALSSAAPVAATFGFEIEDVVALLGKLKDAGFDASSAGTAVRNILLNLADANGDLAKELGGAVSNFDELIPAMVELRESGVDLNKTLELTDKRSVAAFNTLLRTAEGARVLRDDLQGVTGELSDMAGTMDDNVQGALGRLGSAWEGFVLTFRNSSGVFKTFFDGLADAINNITDSISESDQERFERLFLTSNANGGKTAIDLATASAEDLKGEIDGLTKAIDSYNSRLVNIEEGSEEWKFYSDQIALTTSRLELLKATLEEVEQGEELTTLRSTAEVLQEEIARVTAEVATLRAGLLETEDIDAFAEQLNTVEELEKRLKALQEIYSNLFRSAAPESITSILPQQLTSDNDVSSLRAPDGLADMSSSLIKWKRELELTYEEARELSANFWDDMSSIINEGVENSINGLAGGIGELLILGESGLEGFGKGILRSIGEFMQEIGGLMISYGLAMVKFQASISAGIIGGPVAIAAGALLVAAGGALSAISSKTSSAAGKSSSQSSGVTQQDIQPLELTTRISGNDIIFVIGNQETRLQRSR